jgi:hypothetical protein
VGSIRKNYGGISGASGPFFVDRIERLFGIQLENPQFIRKPCVAYGLIARLETIKKAKKSPQIKDLEAIKWWVVLDSNQRPIG